MAAPILIGGIIIGDWFPYFIPIELYELCLLSVESWCGRFFFLFKSERNYFIQLFVSTIARNLLEFIVLSVGDLSLVHSYHKYSLFCWTQINE